MAQFEIYKDEQGKFAWRLRARRDEVIARSPRGYDTKPACRRSVAVTKALARRREERFFKLFKDQRDRFRWRLRLNKDEVLAVSPTGYRNRQDCKQAIDRVRRLAPKADVVDQTKPPPPNPPVASFSATP